MQIHTIHSILEEKDFDEDQAYALVDLMMIVTAKSKNRINAANAKLDIFKNYPKKIEAAHAEVDYEIQNWSNKIRRIGGVPLALYKVRINTGGGFFIWEYPSVDLEFNPA